MILALSRVSVDVEHVSAFSNPNRGETAVKPGGQPGTKIIGPLVLIYWLNDATMVKSLIPVRTIIQSSQSE
jgi:hypothetical protein